MYIDENRPNIFLINNSDANLIYVTTQRSTPEVLQHVNDGGATIPSPIVIANPLPPFKQGSVGEEATTTLPANGYGSLKVDQAPTKRPPSFTPTAKVGEPFSGDGTSLKSCLYHYGYIRHKASEPGYWFYLTYVNKASIAGYMWTGYRYVYKIIDTNTIQSYHCY